MVRLTRIETDPTDAHGKHYKAGHRQPSMGAIRGDWSWKPGKKKPYAVKVHPYQAWLQKMGIPEVGGARPKKGFRRTVRKTVPRLYTR